jgi:hypothetical protein
MTIAPDRENEFERIGKGVNEAQVQTTSLVNNRVSATHKQQL